MKIGPFLTELRYGQKYSFFVKGPLRNQEALHWGRRLSLLENLRYVLYALKQRHILIISSSKGKVFPLVINCPTLLLIGKQSNTEAEWHFVIRYHIPVQVLICDWGCQTAG